MATRFYLSNVASGYTPATWKGAWDETTKGITRKLSLTRAGNFTNYTAVENSITNLFDEAVIRFVSDPLTGVTVSGSDTLQWIMGVVENASSANNFFHVHAWVTTGNSDTVRGTLLTDNIGATEFQDITVGSKAQGEGAKTLTSVTITTGDRIVIEMGYQAQNTSNGDRDATMYFGGTTASDLVANDTTLTSKVAWAEFSTNITASSTDGGGNNQWFFTNSSASYTPSSWLGSWDATASAVTMLLSPTQTGTSTTVAIAEVNTTNLWDVALARFVSEPLSAGTITTADTIEWSFGAMESSASANDFDHVHIWISQGNSTTPRATLITNAIGAVEWTVSPTAQSRLYQNTTLGAVTVTAGDRLIIEIGYQGQNTSATSFTGTLNYGGTGEPLRYNDTTVTTRTGWLELSANLAVQPTVTTNTSAFFSFF